MIFSLNSDTPDESLAINIYFSGISSFSFEILDEKVVGYILCVMLMRSLDLIIYYVCLRVGCNIDFGSYIMC